MMVNLQCPGCRCPCAVDEARLGTQVRCPRCQELFTAAVTTAPPPLPEAIQFGTAPPKPVQSAPLPVAAAQPAVRRLSSWAVWLVGGLAVAVVLMCGVGILGGAMVWVLFASRRSEPQADARAAADALPAKVDAARGNDAPIWTLELDKMQVPNQPLAGRILGADFKATRVQYQNTGLDIGSGPDRIHIFLTTRPGKRVYEYAAHDNGFGGRPHIHIHILSTNPPEANAFTNGYAMRLEFGDDKDGKTPCKLYLCLPDDRKSFIAGTFTLDARDGPRGFGLDLDRPPFDNEADLPPRRRRTE
jgi:hypothetical protein